VSAAAQHQRFGNSHQAGLMGDLPRLDPFHHFANLSKRESIESYGLEEDFLLMPAMNSLQFFCCGSISG
jgi:hypothetical protein